MSDGSLFEDIFGPSILQGPRKVHPNEATSDEVRRIIAWELLKLAAAMRRYASLLPEKKGS